MAQQQDSSSTLDANSVALDFLENQKTNVAEEMAEDMAVMNRILDEALEAIYHPAEIRITGAMNSVALRRVDVMLPGLHEVLIDSARRNQIQDALSTYLEDYGVVYQLTVPPPGEEPKKELPPAAAAERPTRWEATRRRVLGTAGDPTKTRSEDVSVRPGDVLVADSIRFAPTGAFPTRNRLAEKLLEVLAENGHNFRHLAPNEWLTVALTFNKDKTSRYSRPKTSRGVSRYGGMGSGGYGGVYGGSASSSEGDEEYGDYGGMEMDEMMEDTGAEAEMGSMGAGMGGMVGSVVGSAMGGVEESGAYGMSAGYGPSGMMSGMGYGYESYPAGADHTAGDLHLRQGNYKKAVEAYEKAVRNRVKKDPYKHQPAGSLVAVYQKLAQAQVGAGEYAKAQQLIEAINNARSKPASPEKSEPRFPAQLVISATKGDLDEVAAGKVTFEEFKKRVTAQYFDPRGVEGESDDAAGRTTTRLR